MGMPVTLRAGRRSSTPPRPRLRTGGRDKYFNGGPSVHVTGRRPPSVHVVTARKHNTPSGVQARNTRTESGHSSVKVTWS